jgi:glucose/arabinose dehydrogenase
VPLRRRFLGLLPALLVTATLTVAVAAPPPPATADLGAVSVALAPVATGLSSPVALAWRTGDERIYVAEQGGKVRIVDATTGSIVGTALTLTGIGAGGERGLLGLAFAPDGTKLYVDHTDASGTIHVVEYPMVGDTAVVGSARPLLAIAHPNTNHNGGQVIVGPDGDLYIGTGDGGGGGDPDGNGQNLGVLLGKILRIDPTPSATLPYTIPADNPFVGVAGARGEIWMYGLRNPWRFSFDRATGDLWIADVGQGLYEEIDRAPVGAEGTNWGWNQREGFHPYNGGAQPPNGVDPLVEESHADGWCAVIGGYVYRGTAIAGLGGAYLFGDLCRSELSAAVQSVGVVSAQADFPVGLSQPTTFGEDHDGELWVADLGGTVSKVVTPPPPTVSVGDKAILEGDAGTRSVTFPVTLSEPGSTTVGVHYTVTGAGATGGTKPGNGVDFKTKSGTVTFPVNGAGVTPITKTVAVPVYGDVGPEGDEALHVTLSAPTGGFTLGRAVGIGTLLNDDGVAPGAALGVADVSVVQQVRGSQSLAIPVTLSRKLTGPVTVHFSITAGSATYSAKKTGGGEFGGTTSGTLSFPAGTTAKNVTVPVWADAIPDADHSFTVTLSGLTGTGVTLFHATGTERLLNPT